MTAPTRSLPEPALAPDELTDPTDAIFRELFEGAPIGMAVLALDERFMKVNATFCKMVGYSNDELRQRTAEDITYGEDIATGRQLAQSLLDGTVRYTGDKRYVHKNGDVLWVSRTASVIRDLQGDPQHFLLMVEDISERKESERALQESRRELETALHANQLIMDNSQDVICTISEDGRFLSLNAACEELWGYTASELTGRQYVDLVHPEDRAKTEQASESLLATGKVTDFVNRYVRKDGTIVDVLWSATWSAKDRIMFCVAHDVTDRARIEKELREAKEEADRANHAKSDFLSRMSHELRTPLNSILGFGQLLDRQTHTETQRPRIRYILSAGRHLLNLINEVLDISRIESGNLQLSLEPVCLEEAIGEAIDLMRPLAAEREIMLSAGCPLQAMTYVLADRQRFKQVLINLLSNAVKYTATQGNVTVSFTDSGNGIIRFIVRDTGAGIPTEKLSRLFTPFDRLGAEQSTVEGTGLGLALCQRLVEAMHGSIGVESALGNGSAFWVELPRAESPFQKLAAQKIGPAPEEISHTGKRRILYIEDNFSNVTLVEQMLAERPALELMTAMQGRVGLDLARKHAPDLVLLDLHLPDLPGWQVLAQLKADQATRDIPVVIISADATAPQIKRLLAAGARAYLTKPFDIAEFFRVLEETVSAAPTVSEEAAA
ncbi:MAG: hybrid sensor histidine kinase/response regulator [Chthoniobacterales bacterium]|nr:MAG: hybrid sensor histidine kinase/response regulator [Chthoniobacterales bacterium]